jgi:hypothetical protein
MTRTGLVIIEKLYLPIAAGERQNLQILYVQHSLIVLHVIHI